MIGNKKIIKIFILTILLIFPVKTFSWTPEVALESKKNWDLIFKNIWVSEEEVLKMKKNWTIYYYIDFYKFFWKISEEEKRILKNYIFSDNSLNKELYKNFDYDFLYPWTLDDYLVCYFKEIFILMLLFFILWIKFIKILRKKYEKKDFDNLKF